jgi:hypothetical protein
MAPATDTFPQQTVSVVANLRRAVLDLYESVHADPTQPQDVARKFGLDKTLTWRIARTLGEENAWDAVLFVPRRPSIVLLAQALQRAGAPQARITKLLEEAERFEAFIQTHAGDRETFEVMVAGQAQREGSRRLEQSRKDGFTAAAATWGVSARIHLATRLVFPGSKPGMLSLATVCGFLGFRRLRPNLPWTIAVVSDWDMPEGASPAPTPLACCLQAGAPIVPVASSAPSPTTPLAMRTVREGRKTRFVLESGHIGAAASTDVLLAWLHENTANQHAAFAGELGEHGVFVNTPAELIVHDVLVHESLAFAKPFEAACYGMLTNGPTYPSPDAEEARLPVPTPILDLGTADLLHLAGFASYPTLLRTVCQSLSLAPQHLRCYRMTATYPPVPSLFVQRHPLLPPR